VRAKRVLVVIVERLVQTTRRLGQLEIRRAHSAEPVALCLASPEQLALPTLQRTALLRAQLAQQEWQSDPLAPAFFAPGRQL
jgi:hypothetical protein